MATETKEPKTEHAQGEQTQKRTSTGALVTVAKVTKPVQAFLDKFNNDWSMNLAAGLAYNLLMSIFPIIIALLAIFGLILGAFPSVYMTLINNIQGLFQGLSGSSSQIHMLVKSSLDSIQHAAGFLAIIAIILAIFNGSRLFIFMEGCFDIIYHVRPRDFIHQNIMAIGMLLLFIVLIPIIVFVSSVPALVLSLLNIHNGGFLVSLASIVGSLIVGWILFEAIYMAVPNQKISFRNSWIGALVAAVLLQIYLTLFPLYVARFLSAGPIGTAGFFIILLVFFYYFGLILFLGAEVNAFFSEGIRATPYDIPTLVHLMTSHLPTSEKAMREQAAATHKNEQPKVILPKNEATSTLATQTHYGATLADTTATPASAAQDQSPPADKDTGTEHHKKQKKSKAGNSRTATILEAVVGTVLAFLVELIRLRRKK